jgi:hypothetical protein
LELSPKGNTKRWGVGFSQVASQETYGTLGAIVHSNTGLRQVGFLTNRHVAVDLDYPSQKMFHPLPPSLGPGVYLGAVERATSFITDDLWYGIFASMNPGESGKEGGKAWHDKSMMHRNAPIGWLALRSGFGRRGPSIRWGFDLSVMIDRLERRRRR